MSDRTDSRFSGRWRPRLSIRGMVVLILIAALSLGWYSALQREMIERINSERRLRFAEGELREAIDTIKNSMQGVRPDRNRPFWQCNLEGTNLAGMTIKSPANAFQKASFRECDLENAILEGGAASFQLARFDRAKLAHATLTGGAASFQRASFVSADLTGAVLTGGTGSFQGATFESAVMVDAKLTGNFQSINIDGTRFEGADLSAIDSAALTNCAFERPPTYNAKTKFPQGFDPMEHSWRLVDQ